MGLQVIQAFTQSQVNIALLHGYGSLTHGISSGDTDIVVDRPPAQALRACRPRLRALGLRPIAIWPYDLGGTVSVFLTDSTASIGVHLDLLYDPTGLGRYGLMSDALLARREMRDGIPVIAQEAEVIYLWRKRIAKNQLDRLPALTAQAQALSEEALKKAAASMLGSHHVACDVLVGRPRRMRRSHRLRLGPRVTRLQDRIRKPVGYWVHWPQADPATVEQVATRFERILPDVTIHHYPCGLRRSWMVWIKDIAPARWRAALVLTHGEGHVSSYQPSPDLLLPNQSDDPVIAARQIVQAMGSRIHV